jgi:hypothetical protein
MWGGRLWKKIESADPADIADFAEKYRFCGFCGFCGFCINMSTVHGFWSKSPQSMVDSPQRILVGYWSSLLKEAVAVGSDQ